MPAATQGGGRGGGAGSATLGLNLSYRTGAGEWINLTQRGPKWTASPENGTVTYANDGAQAPVRIVESYKTDGGVLDWTIDLERTGKTPVEIGDLGISIPVAGPSGENPTQIFERGFLRHQFISGHGSFFYFVRASGAPPFLLVTVRPGTKLEYAGGGGGRGGAQVYVHSGRSGGAEKRGTWRQAHTTLDLGPAGRPAARPPTASACNGPTATRNCAT